jgi:hypothetical protein
MPTVAVSGMPSRGLLRILGLAFGVVTVVGGGVGIGILRTAGTIAGLLASPRLVAYEQRLEVVPQPEVLGDRECRNDSLNLGRGRSSIS